MITMLFLVWRSCRFLRVQISTNKGRHFLSLKLWTVYPTTSGQATPSANGHSALAQTIGEAPGSENDVHVEYNIRSCRRGVVLLLSYW